MKRANGLSIPQTLEEVCHPQRLALVVYDMQAGILSQIKNAEEITQNVLKVLAATRDAGVRVFFSRHLSLPKELMGMSQFRMAMAWQRVNSPEEVKPWFVRDTPGFEIIPELSPRPTEGVFDKLKPTARHGADLGYIPVLVTDACGPGNEEAAKRSIESLKFAGDALITNTETICDVLRKRAALEAREPQSDLR